MARMTNTLRGRIAIIAVAANAVLLPVLYFSLVYIVDRSHVSIFIGQVRTYSRLVADELELGDALRSRERIMGVLDSVILSGPGVYAELIDDGESIRSRVGTRQLPEPPREDFEFGSGADQVYYVRVPIERPGRESTLVLGFDEQPTAEEMAAARRQMLSAMAVYFAVVLAIALFLSARLARPLAALQGASRRVANGDFTAHLDTSSSIAEVRGLALDLESMRTELVGKNAQLQQEMADREAGEAKRRALERRLQQEHQLSTLGTLAGGLAHEINNVLVPIQLYSETAREDLPEGHSAREDLDRVLAAAARAKKIVSQVLTFGRHDASVEARAIQLAPVINATLDFFTALASPDVDVQRRIDGHCSDVCADPTSVDQIIMNLCTNAYQAMAGSRGTLIIALSDRIFSEAPAPGVPAGRYVELDVSDTGHGMSPAVLERIFEPFFTTREVGLGTGLGLSVVHGMVTSLGAHILVESEIGRGSRFRVLFPACETGAAQ